MYSAADDPKGPGFPIRKSTDQRVLAPPRSLSQRATSFIASVRQGIHQMPLKRLIQRNPSRPGVSPALFPKGKRGPDSRLACQTAIGHVEASSAKKASKPRTRTHQTSISSPCPERNGRTIQDPARSLSELPTRPAPSTKQKAGRRKAPKALSPHNFRSTLSNNTTGTTGQRPEHPNS